MAFSRKPIKVHNGSDQNVYVKVDNRTLREKQKAVAVNVGAGGLVEAGFGYNKQQKYEESSREGYTMVQRFSAAEFYPTRSTDTAYVSVKPLVPNDPHEYNHLCKDHPVNCDGDGVIITPDFYFRNSDKNKGWVDTEGTNHRPKNTKRNEFLPSGLKNLRKDKK